MKRLLQVTALVVVFAMTFTGVAFGAGQAEEGESGGAAEYAFIVKNLVNPYFVNMKWGAECTALQLGIDLRTFSPDQVGNVEQQIRIVEDLVQSGYKGIVISPIDSQGITTAIEMANEAGIPVITADTEAFGGEILSHVGISNFEVAKAMGEWVVEELGGEGTVVMIEGTSGSASSNARNDGFLEAFNAAPGIEILASQTGNYQKADAMRVTEDFMVRYPEADAYVTFNDSMAMGTVEALKASQMLDDVIVTGINGSQDALASIADGDLDATIEYSSFGTASQAVTAMYEYVENGVEPPEYVSGAGDGYVIILDENVEEYIGRIEKLIADRCPTYER